MKFFDIFRKVNKRYSDENIKIDKTNNKTYENILPYPQNDNTSKETILNDFKNYLSGYNKWSKSTKSTYFNSLKNALANQEFNSVSEINTDKLKNYLTENAKRKNDVSKIKSSFALLLKSNNKPVYKKINEIENIRKLKPRRYKRHEKELLLKNTLIKINAMKNTKLKLGYRLMLTSGLRVSEISNLRKKDIEFCDNNRIKVNVLNAKGNKNRKFLTFCEDKYLYNSLKNHINSINDNEKIFYSSSHIRKHAGRLKFKSHDLRKAFAQIVYYHYPKNEKETVEVLQKLLGHNLGSKTYLIYKDREINLQGTKYDV